MTDARRMSRHVLAFAVVLLSTSGCAPASPSSPAASAPPSAVAGEDFFLPEGCHAVDIRGPDGRPVDLSGRWIGADAAGTVPDPPAATDWQGEWIRQTGDCLYGVSLSFIPEEPTLAPDLFVWVARLNPALEWRYQSTQVTESDPTLGTVTLYAAAGWDASGRMMICSSLTASAVRSCPDIGPEASLQYRVADLVDGS